MAQHNLAKGDLFHNMILFSLPYLLSYFLQTLYGLADLLIAGRFNGPDVISAVSIGSQVMHMVTVMIVGLAMGTTVTIGRFVGAEDDGAPPAAWYRGCQECFCGCSHRKVERIAGTGIRSSDVFKRKYRCRSSGHPNEGKTE